MSYAIGLIVSLGGMGYFIKRSEGLYGNETVIKNDESMQTCKLDKIGILNRKDVKEVIDEDNRRYAQKDLEEESLRTIGTYQLHKDGNKSTIEDYYASKSKLEKLHNEEVDALINKIQKTMRPINHKEEDVIKRLKDEYKYKSTKEVMCENDGLFTESTVAEVSARERDERLLDLGAVYEGKEEVSIPDFSEPHRMYRLIISNLGSGVVSKVIKGTSYTETMLNIVHPVEVAMLPGVVTQLNERQVRDLNHYMNSVDNLNKTTRPSIDVYYKYKNDTFRDTLKKYTGADTIIMLKFRKSTLKDSFSVYNKGLQIKEVRVYCKTMPSDIKELRQHIICHFGNGGYFINIDRLGY